MEPQKDLSEKQNEDFIENLERLYKKIHQNSMQAKREMPNARIMLGFAAQVLESVKSTAGKSDFIG